MKEGNEKIIYFAPKNQVLLREIYFCKADSQNDKLFVRIYVPPQVYKRYMALSKECAEQRWYDKELKTQIRYGHRDMEIFTKYKGPRTAGAAGPLVLEYGDFFFFFFFTTNFCSNLTIFQFHHNFTTNVYHRFYHKLLPQTTIIIGV